MTPANPRDYLRSRIIDDDDPSQLHNEMRTASKFHKPNMKNVLNNIIDTLVGQGASAEVPS